MEKKDVLSIVEISKEIKTLDERYQLLNKSGIFFILSDDKNPLDILGVLDVLKYKIKKWNNANIFSYSGIFFKGYNVIIIGSSDMLEATQIIMTIFFKKFTSDGEYVQDLISKAKYREDLEKIIKNLILSDIERGFPHDMEVEKKISHHLEKILEEKNILFEER
jgi:hypothetical protein